MGAGICGAGVLLLLAAGAMLASFISLYFQVKGQGA